MPVRSLLTFAFTTLALSFCSTPTQPSENASKALQLYEETLALEAETMSIFESLEQVIARDTTLLVFESQVRGLSETMAAWEKTAVGVGPEADHATHHHPHAHSSSADLTDGEMLAKQQQMRKELDQIAEQVSALIEEMMDLRE